LIFRIILLLLFCISCKSPYQEITDNSLSDTSPNPGVRTPSWKSLSFFENVQSNDIGGFDVIKDNRGFIHIAALVKATDVSLGNIRYQLIYTNNVNGPLNTIILKSEISNFYKVSSYSNVKNYLSIALDTDNNPIIGYVDRYSSDLKIIKKFDSIFKTYTLNTVVSSFEIAWNSEDESLSIAILVVYQDRYYKKATFSKLKNEIFLTTDISIGYGYNSTKNPIHIRVKNNKTHIFYKIYNNSENTAQFIHKLVEDGELRSTTVLGTGVNNDSEFGLFESVNGYTACKKNILGQRSLVTTNFLGEIESEVLLQISRSSTIKNCWIDQDLNLLYMARESSSYFYTYFNNQNSSKKSQIFDLNKIYKMKMLDNELYVIGISSSKQIKVFIRR
jgi:hypothetical protein